MVNQSFFSSGFMKKLEMMNKVAAMQTQESATLKDGQW